MRSVLFAIALAVAPGAFAQDDDNDGVPNANDNCPTVANANQVATRAAPYNVFGDACLDPSAVLGTGVVLEPGAVIGANVILQRQAHVHAGAIIETDVIVGRSSVIGSGAILRNGALVGYAVSVGENTELGARSTLGNNVNVDDDVTIGSDVVVGRGVTIADNADIGNNTVIGPATTIGEGADIGDGVRIRKDVTIGQRAAIGDNARIGRSSAIEAGATVGANANLRTGVTVGSFAIVDENAQIARYVVIPPGICNPLADLDNDGLFGCEDPDCFSERCPEICDDSEDNDADGDVDGLDSDCIIGPEDCENDGDDNGDGLVDCEDPLCATDPTCGEDACDDGIDNDNDNLTDCEDDDCWGKDCHELTGAISWVRTGVVGLRRVQGYAVNNFDTSDPVCNSAGLYTTNSGTFGYMKATNINGLVQVRWPDPSGSGEVVETCEWNVAQATAQGYMNSREDVTRTGFQIVNPGNCRLGTDPSTQSWFLPKKLRNVGQNPVQAGNDVTSYVNPWYFGLGSTYVASFYGQSDAQYIVPNVNVNGCVFDREVIGNAYNTATGLFYFSSTTYGPSASYPRTYGAYPN